MRPKATRKKKKKKKQFRVEINEIENGKIMGKNFSGTSNWILEKSQ